MKKKPSEIFEKSWERDLIKRGVLDCKCKACNPKRKIIKVKIPKGYNWVQTNKVGNHLEVVFVNKLS